MNAPRPTSPHLSIYRWLITNTLSILHRLTGFSLAVGSLLLVVWLVSAAYYPVFYYDLQEFMGSPVGCLLLLGWTVAFFYHLSNGIRHLFWDAGLGYELGTATTSGICVLVSTIVLTAGSWYYASTQAVPMLHPGGTAYDHSDDRSTDTMSQEVPYGE